jgi:two-component system, NtrC family, sensor kinase
VGCGVALREGIVFQTINRAFQLLRAWLKYQRKQTALIRKIVDRIRNSLELEVVLQSATDEVAALLDVDCCSFLWYFKDTQQVKVVCQQSHDDREVSYLGYHPLESFGTLAPAIAAGELIINKGTEVSNLALWSLIAQRVPWRPVNCVGAKPGTWGEYPYGSQANCPIFGYGASLLIPVTGGKNSIGFLVCLSEQPRHWSTVEIEFLRSIVEPLEVAIRQAQLYKQTQEQAIREQLVNHITSQTRQSFDPEKILTEAIAQLFETLQADRCLVHLVNAPNHPQIGFSSAEVQSAIAIETEDEALPGKRLYEICRPPFSPSINEFDRHGPITQWVIQHRQLVMIPDITNDKRIGKANEEYQKAQIKSSLVVPVQANGTLHAILYLNQCSHIRYWSKNDQKLAQAVADQLAISLQQAYLYAHTQQQAAYSTQQAQKMSEMIDQLRLAQAQLIQSEKMSSLGRMVAGVAHEINNPINFIYGNIPYVENYVRNLIQLMQAYQGQYPDPPAPVQTLADELDIDFILRDLPKILKSMESGAERIQEIVQLLQKFSGNNISPLKVIDINVALENTLLIVHNQITGTIKVERHYDNLPPVECYPKAINQAFLSILTNAIEALNRSPKVNKTITLRTQWVPSREKNEGRVQIAIADNGPGMKAEIQPRIFEPFFTTKDVGQGRGLGLTESYQTLINQHNGRLEVRSQPGQGAQFLIEIPVRQSKPLSSDLPAYNSAIALSPTQSVQAQPKSVATATNNGC